MPDFIEIIQSHVINIKHLTIIEFPGFMTQLKWETLQNLVDLDIELIEDEDEDEAASVSSPNQTKPKKSKKKGKKGKKGKKARQG